MVDPKSVFRINSQIIAYVKDEDMRDAILDKKVAFTKTQPNVSIPNLVTADHGLRECTVKASWLSWWRLVSYESSVQEQSSLLRFWTLGKTWFKEASRLPNLMNQSFSCFSFFFSYLYVFKIGNSKPQFSSISIIDKIWRVEDRKIVWEFRDDNGAIRLILTPPSRGSQSSPKKKTTNLSSRRCIWRYRF